MSQAVCLICRDSSIFYVHLNDTIDCGFTRMRLLGSENNEKITYLECLHFCSKIEFVCGKDIDQNLCCACAVNLERTYFFLQKLQKAHERLLLRNNDAVNANVEDEKQLSFATELQLEDEVALALAQEVRDNQDDNKVHAKMVHLNDLMNSDEEFMENANKSTEEFLQVASSVDENEKKLSCQVCKKKFFHIRNLKAHARAMHKFNISMEYCKHCCKLVEKAKFREHMNLEHCKVVLCDQCEYQCLELSMARHKRNAHGTGKYECNICKAKFIQQCELSNHLKYHRLKKKGGAFCNVCNKKFACRDSLISHMKTHEQVRQTFDCSQCDRTYMSKGALTSHMRIHEEGKALQCNMCNKKCISATELTVHMRFHTRDFQEMCEICGMKLVSKTLLREHMWMHQGLKLKCDKCHKTFAEARALRHHYFQHRGKPFTCRHCGKHFVTSTKLKQHFKTAHDLSLTREELRKCTNQLEPMPKLCLENYLVAVTDTPAKKTKIDNAKDDDFDSTVLFTNIFDED